MRTTPLPSLFAALIACETSQGPLEVSPSRPIEAPDIEGYEALVSGGPLPHEAIVRAYNRFRAAIPAERTEEITVDGAPFSLGFDGYGYGTIEIGKPGVTTIGGAVEPTEIVGVASDWPDPLLPRAFSSPLPAPATFGVAIETGMVLAAGSTVWWAGEGTVAHQVLDAGDEILGLRAGNIDLDGVRDALVWTNSAVFLLKGRSRGGLGWGGGFEAPGYEVASADMGDISADNLPDIVIAWRDPSGDGVFDVLEGDGLFQFTPAVPRDIPGEPTSIIIGDQTGEGLAQATVLLADGSWARLIRGAEQRYMPIGPSAPVATMILPEGSELLRAGDINADGAGEIGIASRRAEGQPRQLWFVDIATDALVCIEDPENANAQCATEFLPLEDEPGAWVSVADGNSDFYDDIFLAEDNKVLYAVALDPLEIQGRYGKVRVLDLPAYGPIDLLDSDRDGWVDLFLSAPRAVWRWSGRGYDVGSLDRFWEPLEEPAEAVRDSLTPPFLLAELEGGPETIEIVSAAREGGETLLRVLQYTPGQTRADLIGDVVIAEEEIPVDDLALCGTDLYFVAGGEVGRVPLTDPSDPDVAFRNGEGATRVDCGDGPSNGDVAVVEDGDIQLRAKLNLAAVGAAIEADAYDVALGDLGAGPVAEPCETEGCSIVWWPYGGTPEGSVFARSDASGITVEGADGAVRSLDGSGQLSVIDVDADGNLDLISLEGSGLEGSDGLLSIHRSSGDSFARAALYHTRAGWSRSVGVFDGDSDGQNDLWGIDPAGDLLFIRSTPESTGLR